MTEQKLKKVSAADRKAIALTSSTNRRAAENFRREQVRRQGPASCHWCGADSCGVLWTRPGEPEPGGERCCDKCDHEPVEGWQHTHTAWTGLQAYPVCALTLREGESVYLRRDGVVQFIELRAPVPGSALGAEGEQSELRTVPTIAFLGRDVNGLALYLAGEGGPDAIDLWDRHEDLDPVWLPTRMQSAVVRDDVRKERLRAEQAAFANERERKLTEEQAADAARRAADIEKRQLKHEVRVVMSELGDDDAEEAAEMPDDGSESQSVRLGEGVSEAPEAEPARPVNLKEPVPVKKGPGRPKRSARQRRARERQKRAWARQEAQSRLEVKRLERLARTRGETLVKEDE